MTTDSSVVTLGSDLTLANVDAVARQAALVNISPSARERIRSSRAWVEQLVSSGGPITYGINTGFGVFANVQISPAQTRDLMRRLIISHTTGVGDPLNTDVVRAALLIRANALAQGFSGVRPEIVDTLVEMLNRGVHPIVPSKGSLGASGDLAPLSHLALIMSTDEADEEGESGEAVYQGKRMSGRAAMAQAGIPRLILEAKEGLALNNGTSVSAAVAALAIVDAGNLADNSILALALTLEGVRGASNAFDERIHRAARHVGQQEVAARIRKLTLGSKLLDRGGRVQDAYSIRCGPQVMGAALDTIVFAQRLVEEEINAATDNPLIFADGSTGTALSGGNFHGESVGLACGAASMAVAELASISERRTFRLLDGKLNDGLPMMLVEQGGLNSGLMMGQITAAALVSDNKTLAHPDVLDSIPTSANQEDHVPMAANAARHLSEIVSNTEQVIGIELLTACQAIDLRLRNEGKTDELLGVGTRKAFKLIREQIPFLDRDRLISRDLSSALSLVRSRELIEKVWNI